MFTSHIFTQSVSHVRMKYMLKKNRKRKEGKMVLRSLHYDLPLPLKLSVFK